MYKFATKEQEQAYEEIQTATARLSPSPVVEFGFVAVDAMENNSVSSTPGPFPSRVSGKNVTQDPELEKPYSGAFATFEENFWILDGVSRKLAPEEYTDPEPGQDNAFGFVSTAENDSQLSNSDGTYKDPVTITIIPDSVTNFLGISLSWWKGTSAGLDNDEYAKSFKVDLYDYQDSLLGSIEVGVSSDSEYPENSSVDWVDPKEWIGVKRVTITVYKWSTPNRRVRFTSLEFGAYFRYDGELIKSIEVSQEGNPLSLTFPSSEFRFTFLDKNSEFDPDNPKGKYRYLTQNLPITLSVEQPYYKDGALNTLTIPIGVFFLSDWYDGSDETEYVFVAKDIPGLLDAKLFNHGRPVIGSGDIALSDWLEEILDDAELSVYVQGMWEFSGLGTYKVMPIMPEVTHREAVQYVLNAHAMTGYSDRYGKIQFKPSDSSRTDFIITDYMQEERYSKPERLSPLALTSVKHYLYAESGDSYHQTVSFERPVAGVTETYYVSFGFFAKVESWDPKEGVSVQVYGSGVELTVVGSGSVASTETMDFVISAIESASTVTRILNKDEYGQAVVGEALEVDNPTVLDTVTEKDSSGNIVKVGSDYLVKWHNDEALSRQIYTLKVRPDLRLDIGDMVRLYRPNLDKQVNPTQTIWVRVTGKNYSLSDESESMTLTVRGGGYLDE